MNKERYNKYQREYQRKRRNEQKDFLDAIRLKAKNQGKCELIMDLIDIIEDSDMPEECKLNLEDELEKIRENLDITYLNIGLGVKR